MDGWLKQGTAVTVMIGPFLDETDGVTPETGLTISQADVRLSKHGGSFAQKNDANAASHDENGYYTCALNTTDTNTVGILKLAVTESGALPVWHTYEILPANVYDSLAGGTDYLKIEAVEFDVTMLDDLCEALLGFDFSSVAAPASRSLINAARFLRNKWVVAAGTLTVYEEDDVTPAWTGAVSTNPAADPVVGVDP